VLACGAISRHDVARPRPPRRRRGVAQQGRSSQTSCDMRVDMPTCMWSQTCSACQTSSSRLLRLLSRKMEECKGPECEESLSRTAGRILLEPIDQGSEISLSLRRLRRTEYGLKRV